VDVSTYRSRPPGGTMLENDTELHVALADDRDAAAQAARFAALVGTGGRLRGSSSSPGAAITAARSLRPATTCTTSIIPAI
jgi:hypothetical protein